MTRSVGGGCDGRGFVDRVKPKDNQTARDDELNRRDTLKLRL